MTSIAQELVRTCEQLPRAKRMELRDFAQFLLDQEDDRKWEDIISSRAPRPKLDAFLEETASEGAEPLNLGQL